MIKGIVYISKAAVGFNLPELKELSEIASECNQQHEISGYLYFEKGYFLQYIEGENTIVDRLLDNIKKDKRHEVLNIQAITEIGARKFPTWHMHRLTKSSLIQINMENVLMDYLTYCSTKENIDINEENIWRMVDKLSKFRKKLLYSI